MTNQALRDVPLPVNQSLEENGMPVRTANQFEAPQQEDTEQEPKVTDGENVTWQAPKGQYGEIELEKKVLPTDEGQDPFKEIKVRNLE